MDDEYQYCTIDPANVSVGDVSPEHVVDDVSRTDIVRYVGASGDFNRLHHDEPFATEAGHPSVLAPGMFIASIGSTLAADWLGLDAIKRFVTRFRNPIYPGDTLTAQLTVTDIARRDEQHVLETELTLSNQEDTDVVTGQVTASYPAEDIQK
jgi:acyl dehydratase